MRVSVVAGATLALVLLVCATATAEATPGTTMIELRTRAACTEAVALVTAGAELVAPTLGLYRLRDDAARVVLPGLRARNAVALAEPDRRIGTLAGLDFADPLIGTEWWRAAIGIDQLTPPPAGRPVSIVDSGIDLGHPEFLGRPGTEALNEQEPAPIGGVHGTAVASLIGAPANGLGIVGIYPEALLRSWDAAKGEGTQLETSEIARGILAAATAGPGVVNLSLGSDRKELVIEQAVYQAVRMGTLVVAASGNDGDHGSPLGYPAAFPHVLTVGASDPQDGVATFSSRSRFVDLVAPGTGIEVAAAIEKSYSAGDGTSYAAPLVSGAAAWVWTVRPDLDASQLFEVMRRSAQDIGSPGRDDAAGFGLLNVPAALAYPAPIRDPFEPNDDIEFVRPNGTYDTGIPPLTTRTRRTATVQARLAVAEDPRDVYRIWLPKSAAVTVTIASDLNLDLGLWKQGTASVTGRNLPANRLARAATAGPNERLTFRNLGPGRFAFLAVTPGQGTTEATYRLRVAA